MHGTPPTQLRILGSRFVFSRVSMATIDDTRCVLSFLHFIPESSSHLKEEEGPRDEGGEGQVFVLLVIRTAFYFLPLHGKSLLNWINETGH